ncbi:MAG: hypothetical protein PWP03_60 [Candidatus Woesearchaeota archaeon]|nr:hypothetical protein [Candidatus Woesearchaeota archaeon]MDN5327422.1 hypothetical protein [Candidatus Woesearchaeota archaeon]
MLTETISNIIFVFFYLSQVLFWYTVIKKLKSESLFKKLSLFLIILFFVFIKIFLSNPYYGSDDDDDLYIYEQLYVKLYDFDLPEGWYGSSENPFLITSVLYPIFKLLLILNPNFRLLPLHITFFTLYSSVILLLSFYFIIKLLDEKSILPVLILVLFPNFFFFSRSLSYIFISHCYFLQTLLFLYLSKNSTKKVTKKLFFIFSLFLLFYSAFIKVDNLIFVWLYFIFWLNLNDFPLMRSFFYSLILVPFIFLFKRFFNRILQYLESQTILKIIKNIAFFIFKSPKSNFIFFISLIVSPFVLLKSYFWVLYLYIFLIMYSFSYNLHLIFPRFRYGIALLIPAILILVSFLNKAFFKKHYYLKQTFYFSIIFLEILCLFMFPVKYNKSEMINYLETHTIEGFTQIAYMPMIFGVRPLDYALILKSKNPEIEIKPLNLYTDNHKINIDLKKTDLIYMNIPDSCKEVPTEKISEALSNLSIDQLKPYCYDFKWSHLKEVFREYNQSKNKDYSLKRINFTLVFFDYYGVYDYGIKYLQTLLKNCNATKSSFSYVSFYNLSCE